MLHVLHRVHNDPSWSSKVDDSGTSRKREWDFLRVPEILVPKATYFRTPSVLRQTFRGVRFGVDAWC